MLHFKDASARVRVADLVVKSQVVFSVRSQKFGEFVDLHGEDFGGSFCLAKVRMPRRRRLIA